MFLLAINSLYFLSDKILIHSLLCFLFSVFFSVLFYCGTKNVKAVKGCSVFYESLSSLVIETNVIHSKVREGYLYERKGS